MQCGVRGSSRQAGMHQFACRVQQQDMSCHAAGCSMPRFAQTMLCAVACLCSQHQKQMDSRPPPACLRAHPIFC